MFMRDQAKRDERYILPNIVQKPLSHRGAGMLTLTRRISETIVIGDDTRIVVLGINGQQVRIGIKAPKEVSVHREEIYKKIQLEKENGIKRN